MVSAQAIKKQKKLKLIGAASCIGAQDTRCDMGPTIIRASNLESLLNQTGIDAEWENILRPKSSRSEEEAIVDLCNQLAKIIAKKVEMGHQFAVIGGDHSCAVGTWSGAANALKSAYPANSNPLGLIWVDAHMDSHTPQTSPSGAYHGMPLACLLDEGLQALREIGSKGAKLLAEHVCLVGVRSYESAEASLLKQLGARVFFMDEVKQRGLTAVMNDALSIVKNTTGFGISIDLDAVDPVDAPGVGSPTQDGLQAEQLIENVMRVKQQDNFIGIEITEFNPFRDVNNKTANLIIDLICATG
ncbi:MAG: arginase [Gammaproteobacteria bacterium]|nr:arginase [Gammaproteobacteria bacterium]